MVPEVGGSNPLGHPNQEVALACQPGGHDRLRRRVGERVTGIEPASSTWKAEALPLSYTRVGRETLGACGTSGRADSNRRPPAPKAGALPTAPLPVRGKVTGRRAPALLGMRRSRILASWRRIRSTSTTISKPPSYERAEPPRRSVSSGRQSWGATPHRSRPRRGMLYGGFCATALITGLQPPSARATRISPTSRRLAVSS